MIIFNRPNDKIEKIIIQDLYHDSVHSSRTNSTSNLLHLPQGDHSHQTYVSLHQGLSQQRLQSALQLPYKPIGAPFI